MPVRTMSGTMCRQFSSPSSSAPVVLGQQFLPLPLLGAHLRAAPLAPQVIVVEVLVVLVLAVMSLAGR